MCILSVAQYGGQVPRSREALEALPSVDRKVERELIKRIPAEFLVDAHH